MPKSNQNYWNYLKKNGIILFKWFWQWHGLQHGFGNTTKTMHQFAVKETKPDTFVGRHSDHVQEFHCSNFISKDSIMWIVVGSLPLKITLHYSQPSIFMTFEGCWQYLKQKWIHFYIIQTRLGQRDCKQQKTLQHS